MAVAEGIHTAAVVGTAGRVDKQAVLRVGSGQIEPVAAVGTQRFQIVDTRICSIESQSVSYFRLPFDGDYRIALARQMHGVDAQTRCQVGHLFAGLYERGMEACQTVGSGLFGVYAARKIESRVGC